MLFLGCGASRQSDVAKQPVSYTHLDVYKRQDVCVAHPPVGAARALYIFLRAKGGKHVRFKQIELRRCRTLHLEFDEAPPAQMDGELIEGTSFDIAVEPAALNVLVPF